jgi:hypothetical protein
MANLPKGNIAMKSSIGIFVLTLIALLLSSASADEAIYIAIRTLIRVEESLSKSEINAIDTAMHNIKTELDNVVKEVVSNVTVPAARYLRVGDDRKLPCSNACQYYPPNWTMCYVSGVWIDRCRRALTMHNDLTEEEVADLNEDDRRRHLQISSLCKEAKMGIASVIGEAESEGLIPFPPDSKFAEQCFYEIIDH